MVKESHFKKFVELYNILTQLLEAAEQTNFSLVQERCRSLESACKSIKKDIKEVSNHEIRREGESIIKICEKIEPLSKNIKKIISKKFLERVRNFVLSIKRHLFEEIKIVVVCQHNQARSQLLQHYLQKYLLEYPENYVVDSGGVELKGTRPINLKLKAIQAGQHKLLETLKWAEENDPTLYKILAEQYSEEGLKGAKGGLHEIDSLTDAVAKPLTRDMIQEANLVICVSKDVWEVAKEKFGNDRKIVPISALLKLGDHEIEIKGRFGLKVSMLEHWKATRRVRGIAKRLAKVLHERFSRKQQSFW
ncbi:hypothetical protein D6745_04025 [Candidatus Woesearchaeota archaeon]|nr:MAG: hypothetical protein D6745_04025 [Candidatus Woesearchaeota archaeon]